MDLEWLLVLCLAVGAYLVGGVPTAYIMVRRVRRQDIRGMGSGNVGALNTYHQIGLAGAAIVLLVDAGKGALAVLAPSWVGAPEWAVFATTPLVVAGHNWPVYLKFRGGKGAATIFGVSLALVPVLTLITLGPVVVAAAILRNVVLGIAVGFVMMNALLLVTDQDPAQVGLCIFLTALVTLTYLYSKRGHLVTAVRSRRWRELFTNLA